MGRSKPSDQASVIYHMINRANRRRRAAAIHTHYPNIQKGTGHLFPKRLHLVIKSPNLIYTQKNYNAGGVVAEESGDGARTAHVTLFHDAEHASYLELPIAD